MDYISSMISADENETFAFVITVDDKVVGSIGVFRQENIHRVILSVFMQNRLHTMQHLAECLKKWDPSMRVY